ncbi:DUF5606 family protein [Chondrinema litorale]|uniref:DUF5606 family protein n=1 Tax=Chondrinema litorale TaxID=2994555 RepID=UPI002542DE27|nr:DUF5606 domain-containing protein [Chondrinema litorale]UZR95746.1 DUF5606 domain-containing protein [Chondrinema litorale]
MTLKDIVAIAGKPGLYKILKLTRNGMIVEAMEGKPVKFVVNASHRISVLKEISIYTHTQEESIPLGEVFNTIKEKQGESTIDVDIKDQGALLRFLEGVVPDYDRDKVYASDVKKLVSWYNTLLEKAPEVFEEEKASEEDTEKEDKPTETSEETKAEKKDEEASK